MVDHFKRVREIQAEAKEHDQRSVQARALMQRIMTNSPEQPCPFCNWKRRAGLIQVKNMSQDLVLGGPADMCPIHKMFEAQRAAMERCMEFCNGHANMVDAARTMSDILEDVSKEVEVEYTPEALATMTEEQQAAWSAKLQELFPPRLSALQDALEELAAQHMALPQFMQGTQKDDNEEPSQPPAVESET